MMEGGIFRVCDIKECDGGADCYGMTEDGEVMDLCSIHFGDYFRAVARRKFPMPNVVCSVCGRSVEMTPAQFTVNMRLLDNRGKRRHTVPRYRCRDCDTGMLSWATTSTGFVVFGEKEVKA